MYDIIPIEVRIMYKILRKEKLNDVVELMEVHAPYVANLVNLLY